ncbi:hypothetical protein BROUX41_000008 [Berkeleyomyces rouxiae]|uniref:uncharacterized protein n=1 Tax=Berkeleyomyces rouxiae TaxID=2035830 RepID=UPI003B7A0E59
MEDKTETPRTPIGEPIKTSCERCRRRKIKCDRNQPCGKCVKARTECVRGTGEKQRPASKNYVQALEAQVATLDQFIRKVAEADSDEREKLLLSYVVSHTPSKVGFSTPPSPSKPAEPAVDTDIILARPRAGHLCRLRTRNASRFYGGTSLLQIHTPEEVSESLKLSQDKNNDGEHLQLPGTSLSSQNTYLQYGLHDETSRRMMAAFFRNLYPYNMMIYREYFIRDYDAGSGRHYSDVLLYAICALGALASDDPMAAAISQVYASQSQALLLKSLDEPDICMLQALILLGYREIGHNNPSKGWLFCGMAFRLVHEMGLHLDPNNWGGSPETSVDREILRRVYWCAFIVDKQLSLYFGRPPALYPRESDVRNTAHIPYPSDWQKLLDTYISEETSAGEFEDDVALVGTFIYQAELANITHVIITEIFENRRSNPDSSVTAAKARQAHLTLIKWLSELPGKLHWNQWTVGKTPPQVLHLHMVFHTLMIILHRPPQQLFSKLGIGSSEDVEICYQSLNVLLRLMRSYSRYYDYRWLPLNFVHTLATAAGTVLMKRFLDKLSWDDQDVCKNLSFLINAMDSIVVTWPCVSKIRDMVISACSNPNGVSQASFTDQFVFTDLIDGFVNITEEERENFNRSAVPLTPAVDEIGDGISMMSKSYAVLPEISRLKDAHSLGPTTAKINDRDFGPLVTDDAIIRHFEWDFLQDTSTCFMESLPTGH